MAKLIITGVAAANAQAGSPPSDFTAASSRFGFGYGAMVASTLAERYTPIFPIKAKKSGVYTHSIWGLYDRDVDTFGGSAFDSAFILLDPAQTAGMAAGGTPPSDLNVTVRGGISTGHTYNIRNDFTVDHDYDPSNGYTVYGGGISPLPSSLIAFSPEETAVTPPLYLNDFWTSQQTYASDGNIIQDGTSYTIEVEVDSADEWEFYDDSNVLQAVDADTPFWSGDSFSVLFVEDGKVATLKDTVRYTGVPNGAAAIRGYSALGGFGTLVEGYDRIDGQLVTDILDILYSNIGTLTVSGTDGEVKIIPEDYFDYILVSNLTTPADPVVRFDRETFFINYSGTGQATWNSGGTGVFDFDQTSDYQLELWSEDIVPTPTTPHMIESLIEDLTA